MTDPRRRDFAAILALLLVAAAPAHGADTEGASAPAQGIEIERSPADSRDYRAFVLDNGLQALVVSDPDADEGAGGAHRLRAASSVTGYAGRKAR